MIRKLTARLVPDSGYALPTVIVLALVMLVLVTGSLSVTASGLQKANSDQDSSGALAAAYAGVAEYQSRLSNDSTYQKYGNPAAVFTQVPASTVSLPSGSAANAAFVTTQAGAWAPVPGSDGRSSFRYEVNNSQYGVSGVIKLRVTGRVDGSTATIVADLRQKGFLDFLYFTDFETSDPLIVPTYNSSRVLIDCEVYGWPAGNRDSRCPTIQFAPGDVIKGPLHSNDRLKICSSRFEGAVTSASSIPYINACSPNPQFTVGNGVTYKDRLSIPPTNSQLKKEARNDLSAEVPRPGCLYTGPTSITLNTNGTMNVVSPWTKFTNISMTGGIPSANPAQCGSLTALNSSAGATIPVLDKNLIYVQNVPNDSTDPNFRSTTPSGFTCSNSGADQGWTFGGTTYPRSGESRPATSTSTAPAYGCKNGDVFVKGTLKGELTIGAENYVYITGDILYDSVASSILGLIGQNAVWVYNPMTFTYQDNDRNKPITGDTAVFPVVNGGRTIQAAVLSVAHTIMVQNYQYGGERGTLTVLGALAQKFRGTVGQTSTDGYGNILRDGYIKAYAYDERLRFAAPPKFLTPVTTTYGITQYGNVAAAYKPDGTPIP